MTWQIVKENEIGEEVWRYDGHLIARENSAILMNARFNRDDFVFNGMPLNRGDRFIEAYYQNRWFNIMEIYAGESDQLKGWYCNITFPTLIHENEIHYRDLALDILIFADQRHFVLDEDEFDVLVLPQAIKKKARKTVEEVLLLFAKHDYKPIRDWFAKL
jgi:protein associated with RNAse G/E